MDAAILKAHERHTHLSSDEEAQILYEMRETSQIEWNSQAKAFRREGIEEGLQQGRMETNLENARNLKALGVSFDIIAQATGLALDVIEKL